MSRVLSRCVICGTIKWLELLLPFKRHPQIIERACAKCYFHMPNEYKDAVDK